MYLRDTLTLNIKLTDLNIYIQLHIINCVVLYKWIREFKNEWKFNISYIKVLNEAICWITNILYIVGIMKNLLVDLLKQVDTACVAPVAGGAPRVGYAVLILFRSGDRLCIFMRVRSTSAYSFASWSDKGFAIGDHFGFFAVTLREFLLPRN